MIAFLYPSAFLGLLALGGILYYVYRQRGIGKEQRVSSLLFFPTSTTAHIRKKIFIPWRLICEALFGFLLIALLAGTHRPEESEHTLIVIDNSLSSGQSGVLEELLSRAVGEILSKPLGVFSVATTNPQRVLAERVTSFEASEALSGIVSEFGSDNLPQLLPLYVNALHPSSIKVFTDRPGESHGSKSSVFSTTIHKGSNVSIKEAQLTANVIALSILSEANAAFSGEITLQGAKESTLEKLSKQTISVPPGESTLTINVPSTPMRALKLSISSPADNNPMDNEFWFASQGQDAILVRSPFSIEALGLNQIAGFQFSKEAQNPKSQIVHQMSLLESDTMNTLAILPQSEKIKALTTPLTRGREDHPFLRFLSAADFNPKAVFDVGQFAPGEDILFSGNAPLLRSSINQGKKLIVVGFELFPFSGKNDPASSVLLLNLLRDLVEGEEQQSDAPLPEFSSIYGSRDITIGVTKTLQTRNFFALEESVPTKASPFTIPPLPIASTSTKDLSLEQLLIYIALGFLIIDLIFLWRKR